MINLYSKKSLLENKWKIKDCDERKALMFSQRNNISLILGKLLTLRNIQNDQVENYLNPNFIVSNGKIISERILSFINAKK